LLNQRNEVNSWISTQAARHHSGDGELKLMELGSGDMATATLSRNDDELS
jgi:hypothetical protein